MLDEVEAYLEPEVGILVAATATLLSPQVRRVVRRGAIYGLTGLLAAGEVAVAVARRLGPGSKAPPASTFLQELAEEARGEQVKRANLQATPEAEALAEK